MMMVLLFLSSCTRQAGQRQEVMEEVRQGLSVMLTSLGKLVPLGCRLPQAREDISIAR
jgi:hypothetical protein